MPEVNKIRRGVSNNTKATTLLKFHEKDASPMNNLFVGQLYEVNVDFRTIGDDSKGLQSFAGKAIPRLVFHFTSKHENVNERRHVFQTILPVESNVDTIPGGKDEWMVNNVFNWIKHVLDVYYLKGRELTQAEEDALSLAFVDYDEDENTHECTYNPDNTNVDEILNAYKVVFENAAAMLNGTFATEEQEATGKPCYKNDKGVGLTTWMKLLRYKKVKGDWKGITSNGDLGFDTFIGEGVIELVKGQNQPTILRIDLAKESITPKETKKAPSIGGANGIPNAGVMAGMGMGTQPNISGAFNEAGGDMPF